MLIAGCTSGTDANGNFPITRHDANGCPSLFDSDSICRSCLLFSFGIVPLVAASFVDSASFFNSFAGVGAFSSPSATRFFGVFDFRTATPDFLSKLPLLILPVCVLSATILVFHSSYLFRYLFPVCWKIIRGGTALRLGPWNDCAP